MSTMYSLLDFGAGRKLERVGPYVLDRPSPAADGAVQKDARAWQAADARFEREGEQGGRWTFQGEIESPWHVRLGELTMELRLTDFGHVGLFPEQIDHWQWISRQIRSAGSIRVLNLFAYTGGSTLAAASAGAEVAHLDAAANVVAWARRNADASNLATAPIRWIVDDALKFVRRELKRKSFYEAIILDPPSYGHGPRGQTWKLTEHLAELLQACVELLSRDRQFVLLTCHSGKLASAAELLKYVLPAAPNLREEGELRATESRLLSTHGQSLNCGAALQWTATASDRAIKSRDAGSFNRPRTI